MQRKKTKMQKFLKLQGWLQGWLLVPKNLLSQALRIAGSPRNLTYATYRLLRAQGVIGLFRALQALLRSSKVKVSAGHTTDYSAWIESAESRRPKTSQVIKNWSNSNLRQPTISILMPVYKPDYTFLQAAIESVKAQSYENWELCICDDGSDEKDLTLLLNNLSNSDPRIKFISNERNEHISRATNKAALLASGEYLGFLDQDDLLDIDALFEVADVLHRNPGIQFVYSDEDKISPNGQRYDPHFKPTQTFEISLAYNVYSHFSVISSSVFAELNGLREGLEGAQDWDLALRVRLHFGKSFDEKTAHIPKILYHWRSTKTSTASSGTAKTYAFDAGLKSVQNFLNASNIRAKAVENPFLPGTCKVNYDLPAEQPSVEIIIPTRDALEVLRPCVESIFTLTTYENYSLTIVDNGSAKRETLEYLASLPQDRVKIIRDESPFNYSSLNNNAVALSNADFICLLNNDIQIISSDWLQELVSVASQEGNGAVGPMLWYPDMTVQHAGVVLGIGGELSVAGHWQKRAKQGSPGYMGRLAIRQNFSAVTGACLVLRRKLFIEVGGFDPLLRVAFNDVDLCLRIQKVGLRNVWTPFVEMIHHESISRGAEDNPEKIARATQEVLLMRERWLPILLADPCYSENLSLFSEDFAFAYPSVSRNS